VPSWGQPAWARWSGRDSQPRAQTIRWALDRIRERPACQRLRDMQRDTDALKDEF